MPCIAYMVITTQAYNANVLCKTPINAPVSVSPASPGLPKEF